MNQITHKLNINTKDLVQLLIDNGLLDEYFTSADVNNLFVTKVNNNEKVAQIEVGLNIELDYLKSIEDEAQEKFEEECSNDKYFNESLEIAKELFSAFGKNPIIVGDNKFVDYLNKALAKEIYKNNI